MKRTVAVTGIGLLTPLGNCNRSVWLQLTSSSTSKSVANSVKLGPSNIKDYLLEKSQSATSLAALLDTEASRQMWSHISSDTSKLRCPYAAFLPNEEPVSDPKILKSLKQTQNMSKFIRYALFAVDRALEHSQLMQYDALDKRRVGVSIGSGIGAIEETVSTTAPFHRTGDHNYSKFTPHFVPRIMINSAAGYVSIKHGFMGPNLAHATACAAGAHSIGDAMRYIQFGDADVMLCGGAEAAINPLTINAFSRARALTSGHRYSAAESSRPFDSERDGFVLGEGAAILVLEEREHALKRGAHIFAEISGYGCSGDAHHITAPTPEGYGAERSMQMALKNAGITARDVSYVNAHATSTKLGDVSEARAISRVFAGASDCYVSSTKGATGHLLGAAGALEAVISVLAIHHRQLPATRNLMVPDPDIPKNVKLLLDGQVRSDVDVKHVVSNSFGFGGTNSSLVFSSV